MGLLKKQIAKRLTNLFVQQILQQFNEGLIDIADASFHLQIGRTHLYRLRTRFLRERSHFAAKLSGGDHWPDWPAEAIAFIKKFLPLQKPPNFQLVADELETRLGFKRHRESVAAFARTHFPDLICQPEPRPKARRRWERSRIDELWQHDSSSHQWWPARAPEKARGWGGGSPLLCSESCAVSNRNCVAVMRGGEQRNENDQSVT